MTNTGGQRYRFGDYELDMATRQLSHSGSPVTLQPRVFALLAYLIEQRDRAVDKDAIQDAVWRDMIVSETALTRAIMKARRAVGDDADSQSVIRTVHGHGYQFVAELRSDDAQVVEPPKTEVQESSRKMRMILAVAAIILVTGIALLSRSPATPDGVRLAVLPIQNVTGDAEYDWAKFGLMGLANDLLIDAADMDIVSAADIVRFVQNAGWSGELDAANADENLATLRRAFGASHILISTLEQNVGGLRLNYTLVGPTGRRSDNTMVSDQAPSLVRGMVRSIGSMLGSKRHVITDEVEIVDEDPFINEAYARAVSFSLEGRCEEALPLFEVVLAGNETVGRAQYEWATCARLVGRPDDAEASFVDLLAALEGETSSSLRADALRGLGVVYHDTGRLDEASASYQKGLDEAIKAEDRISQAEMFISMAILAKDRRDFDGARNLLTRATAVYRALEWEVLPGHISSALANISMNDGKLVEAEGHLDNALASFRELGDRRNEAMMLNNYGFLRRSQGRFEEAEPLHLQSLAIRREIGDRPGQGRILGMLSILYKRKGRHEEARAAAAEAVDIARSANDRLFIATGLAQLASAEQGLGNLDAVRVAYEESREIFIEIEDYSRASQVDLRLVRLDMNAGNLAAADVRLKQILETTLREDYPEPAIEALDYTADLALLRDDPVQAIEYFERALAHIEETGFTGRKTSISTKLAQLYLDDDNLPAAEALIGYIVEQEEAASTYALRARYSSLTGDAQRAVTFMEKAKELAGDRWDAEDEEVLAAYQQSSEASGP